VRAARRDERQAKAAPLLAASGLLEACTPDELMNAARKQAEDWDRTDRKFVRFARLARISYGAGLLLRSYVLWIAAGRNCRRAPRIGADFWRRTRGNLSGRDQTYPNR
jgi:hypothetical protein